MRVRSDDEIRVCAFAKETDERERDSRCLVGVEELGSFFYAQHK